MSDFFIAIIVVVAVGLVAWPVFRRDGEEKAVRVEDTELGEALAEKDAALLAISELEADYEMGNLSRKDYLELRRKYDEQAVALLKSVDGIRNERKYDEELRLDEEIEAQIARVRQSGDGRRITTDKTCPACGAVVLPDALFCSGCGTALATNCQVCSAAVGADDRFCCRCGAALKVVATE